MGTEFQLGKMERDLEMDSGEGCTTLGVHLTLKCTVLKMIKTVKFMLYMLYHN